jgi:vacuolar-type H+-ATPase subunit E/Vma4
MFTDEQRLKYEAMRQMAKEELERVDRLLADEVQRTKQKIEELQQAKKSVKQIYDGACALLGVKSLVEMKDYGIDLEKRA